MLQQLTRHLAAHRTWLAAATVAALTAGTVSTASAETTFKIDINSTDQEAEDVGLTPPITAPEWDGVTEGTPKTIGDVTFNSFGISRTRESDGSANPDKLLADFVFGNAGLEITNLPEGVWDVEIWSFDAGFRADSQIIGIKDVDGETSLTDDFDANADTPFTFQFNSAEYADTFQFFVRSDDESGDNDRERMNAVQLTLIPEPASVALFGLGGIMLLSRRRR